MANTTIDQDKIAKAIDFALTAWVKFLQDKILLITPRDLARPPKNSSRKVTGNLKKSIWSQKISDLEHVVGVRKWFYDTEIYWAYQEFGTVKMPPRSYLRKWLEDNKRDIEAVIQRLFNQYLK